MHTDPHSPVYDPRPALRDAVRSKILSGWYWHVNAEGETVWVLVPAAPHMRSIPHIPAAYIPSILAHLHVAV